MSLFKQDIFIPHVFSFKSKYNNNNNIIAMHICKNLRKKNFHNCMYIFKKVINIHTQERENKTPETKNQNKQIKTGISGCSTD